MLLVWQASSSSSAQDDSHPKRTLYHFGSWQANNNNNNNNNMLSNSNNENDDDNNNGSSNSNNYNINNDEEEAGFRGNNNGEDVISDARNPGDYAIAGNVVSSGGQEQILDGNASFDVPPLTNNLVSIGVAVAFELMDHSDNPLKVAQKLDRFVVRVMTKLLDSQTLLEVRIPDEPTRNEEDPTTLPLALLYYFNTTVSRTNPINTKGSQLQFVWARFQVRYAVYSPNRNNSTGITDPQGLGAITRLSEIAVEDHVQSGLFLKRLTKLLEKEDEQKQQQVPRNDTEQPGVNDGPPVPLEERAVIVDVSIVGRESEPPSNQGGVYAEGDLKKSPSYPEPLSTEDAWQVREWFGLGLFLGTLFLAIGLAKLSRFTQRQQSQHDMWGVQFLTEQGVGELLNVGWRYQEDDDSENGGYGGGGDQLYLQVFDKRKLGYNDNNSILMGDVVVPLHPSTLTVPTTLPSSSNNTTATPDTN
jgi:hypothetical protein